MSTLITNIPPELLLSVGSRTRTTASNQDEIDRHTAELLCEVVKAYSGRTITPDQLLANAHRLSHTNTQENPMQFITNATDTDEADLLRLASEFQTLVRGASPGAIVRLGEQQLTAFKKAIEAAQAELVAKATKLKAAINSSLSVAELMALGETRLDNLASIAGITAAPRHEYEGYDINAVMDEALKTGDGSR